ncbi:fatty acyl-CoA hydrolase precursor, medium chain [Callorhinchus milii]|uniref:fatty acyl-CoA hydrolase precursor, medium chain n=1 Tax=Callorhinchus milii TaxID=7868 RepID=UPI001C3F8194|nr:fatty acyl-CoA hydrolase precursor, medium chain [Callorhinchus milii]
MSVRTGMSVRSVSAHLLCALLVWWSPGGAFAAHRDNNPIVVTKYGQLEGKQVTVKGMDSPVYQYLYIPFAKPPVGSLRFAPPQPPEAWTGIRNSTKNPPLCLQSLQISEILAEMMQIQFPPLTISEDCLYLNIMTPIGPGERIRKLPVMVFIHGGGFSIGGASIYDGSALAAYGDVVVVTIQYRLGILGFLSTGDEHMPGNWGLLDQVEALQWVKGNIDVFGGDPGSVTIFGESAGAMSVSMHIVSPLSSGLFHKAISQSGSTVMEQFLIQDSKSITLEIANLSDCNTDNSQEILTCFREISVDKLINLTDLMISKKWHVAPSVDGVFIPKHPVELFAAKPVNAVPYLLGVNNHEFGWVLPTMFNLSGWEEGIDREVLLPFLKSLLSSIFQNEFLELTINEYMGDIEDRVKVRDLYQELMGDFMMVFPTIRTAKLHRDAGNSVFLYEFQHRPTIYGTSRPDFVKSDHGDDIIFVFGAHFGNSFIKMTGNLTEEEAVLSRTMMSYWANFARNGYPNGDGLVFWPLYDHEERYMQLNLKQEPGTKLKEHRMKFWFDSLPEKIQEMKAQRGTEGPEGEENINHSDL